MPDWVPPSGQLPALQGFTGWGVRLASQRLIWEGEGPRGDGQPKVSEAATGLEKGSSPTLQVSKLRLGKGKGLAPNPTDQSQDPGKHDCVVRTSSEAHSRHFMLQPLSGSPKPHGHSRGWRTPRP